MHPFPINPAKLSEILFEGSDSGDDAASDLEEWDCPTTAVPKHNGVPDVPAGPKGSADAPGPRAPCTSRAAHPIGPMPSWRPGPLPVQPGFVPIPPLVISPTEQAAIRKMHSLRENMAEASQLDSIHRQIAEITSALSSLQFQHFFHESGEGPVYVVRDVPYDATRTRLYELGPDEISQIVESDPCSHVHFTDLPAHTQRHRQPLLSDPAEVQAVLDMQRLHVVSENMGYIV